MNKELQKLQEEYDKAWKLQDLCKKNLDKYIIKLINAKLQTDFSHQDLDWFDMDKECYDSPIDVCVYLNTIHFNQDRKCLFCEEIS